MNIDTSKYTAHTSPGKFEGEAPETEYFYELSLDGDGETIYSDSEDTATVSLFHIYADAADAFNLPLGHYLLLWEDSQGFCHSTILPTRSAAEQFAADLLK